MSSSKLAVPESLKRQLDLFRPLCHRYNTPSGCRHGKDCKMRHDSDWTFDTRDLTEVDFPHTARHVTKNGEVYIVARPPLKDVLDILFKEQRKDRMNPFYDRVSTRLASCQKVITWRLTYMNDHDFGSVAVAKTAGGVYLNPDTEENWAGRSSKGDREHPEERDQMFLLAHGTSVEAGLAIARDGHILLSRKGRPFKPNHIKHEYIYIYIYVPE